MYLITAPRILGYSFNPASFWYLYDETKTLDAVVCEVNNTFDERRIYLVSRDHNKTLPAQKFQSGSSGSPPLTRAEDAGCMKHEETPAPLKIRNSWEKDFHVSPFNSRKGKYSIIAADPLGEGLQGFRHLDTTITLASSKNHAKLVARLSSVGAPLEPENMSPLAKLKLLVGWGWIGFATYPRIVREAARLWFAHKLHVWYRPEPLAASLGRRADETELQLEGIFRQYLRHLTQQSSSPLIVRYIPSGFDSSVEVMRSPCAACPPGREAELEFKVLTPEFYRRFVHYAHDFEALFSEFRESSTVFISNPELLPQLVLKKPPPPVQVENLIDYLYFATIRNLRRRPARIERPLRSSDIPGSPAHDRTVEDIRDFRLSSMDGYVLSQLPGKERNAYRSIVARLFLAERIALGSLGLLWFEGLLLRAGFAWVVAAWVDPFLSGVVSEMLLLLLGV